MIIQKIKKVEFIKEFKARGYITFPVGTIREMGIVDDHLEFYLGCCGNQTKHIIPKEYFKIIE